MGIRTNRFFALPATNLGWWSVGLSIFFVALFLVVSNDLIHFSGRLTIGAGVIAAIVSLLAIIQKHERSWLVWLMLLPGLFALIFALGEILSPH